jgi:hypothetical protein
LLLDVSVMTMMAIGRLRVAAVFASWTMTHLWAGVKIFSLLLLLKTRLFPDDLQPIDDN